MALGYLISPALQIAGTNGKPLTGGTLRVTLHGTSTPYITYKDFTGDRNPADVVLDAKGMAVLIADDGNLYDIYCKDMNGVDQWSRLNVCTIGSGSGGGGTEYYGGYGIDIEDGIINVDSDVIQGKLTAGTNIDITDDTVSVSMTASSTSASSYREAVNSVSQSADGSVSASTRKVVGSEWTLAQTNSAGNKFLKIAEFPCYSGFRYVGSGYTDLVVKCSDSDDGRTYTVAVGLMQAANGNHNFSARLRAVVDYCRSSTQPIKSFYLLSDTEYGSNQSQATLSLWVEFDTFQYNSWTFEALVNTAVGGTGSDSHENAWEFANGRRYTVSALPTGGWQLNSTEPVNVNVPAVGSGDNGKVLSVVDSSGTLGWVSQPTFTQQNADWTATDGVQEILNKPDEKPMVAGSGITITEGSDSITIAAIDQLPTLPSSSYKQYSLMYSTNPNEMSMSWSLRDSRNLSMRETTVGLDSSSSIVITQYMLDNNFAYIYLDKTKFPDIGGGYQWWDVNLWGMRIYKLAADASLAGTEWDMPLTVTTSQIATPDNDLNTMYVSTLRFKWPTSGQGQFTDYQGGLAFTVDLLNSDTDAMFIKIGLSGYTSNLAVGDKIYVQGRARPCTNIM